MISKREKITYNFMRMPVGLKFITGFFLLFGMMIIIMPLIPGAKFYINEVEVSRIEYYTSGYGVFMLIFSIGAVVSTMGLLNKKIWARISFVATFLFFYGASLVESIISNDKADSLVLLGLGIVMFTFFYCYLFVKKSVKDYFA